MFKDMSAIPVSPFVRPLVSPLPEAAANSANEAANLAFRQGKIKFLQIEELVGNAVANAFSKEDYTLADVNETDKWARNYVLERI